MKKLLSLLLFAAMTVTSAWGTTYNSTITFNGVSGDNESSSCTINGVAIGSCTLTIYSPNNDAYSIKTITVSGGGYSHTYSNSEIRTALNNASAHYSTFNTGSGADHDGVYAITAGDSCQFSFTTSSVGNITVTINYKNWSSSWVWPVTLTDSSAPADIRIAATHSRTEIYTTGDFAGLYVASVNSAISGDENATFEWQYSIDNNNWVSGDTHLPDNNSHNNIRPSKAGYYRCVATLSDGTTSYTSNAIQITTHDAPQTYLYANSANTETNLPILVIRTTSSSLPGWADGQPGAGVSPAKTKTSADMKLIWNPNGVNKLSDIDNNNQGDNIAYDRRVRINFRGSTSRTMAKRSLAISAGKKDIVIGGDTDGFKKDKFSFFGGPEEKDWILYSAYQDKSMMRNKLAMDLWSSLGYWAATCTYVEVYIDGKYQGVYVFMDKFERSGDRINVTKQPKSDPDGSKTGYVLKFDKVDLSDPGTWYRGDVPAIKALNNNKCGNDGGCGDPAASNTKQGWEIAYPDPEEDLTPEESTYIKNWLTNFEVELYNAYTGNGVTYEEVFEEYLDLQSFADFMILEEFARNTDGYRASMYFSKDVDGKLKCVAPWDFEMGFGNTRTHGGSLTNIWEYAYGASESCNGLSNGKNEPYYPIPFWWKALMNSTCFKNALKTRWDALTASGQPLNKDVVWARIDAMVSQLNAKGAVSREMQKWDWGTRNSCVTGCTTPAYNNCPWIIVPWGDSMTNSDGIRIHPEPTNMPAGFAWGAYTEDNGGKKTLTYDNEYMLMKGWIADRLINLGTLINNLGASTQTPEQMRECAQAEEYTFTVTSKVNDADGTEICNDGTEEAVLTVGHNITSTCDLTYQWYKDGAAMSGKTKKTLSVTEAGDYYCAVTINRLGGIPTILYQNVASNTVSITTRSCSEPVDDSDLVPVENNNTICITCQTAQKKFTITANGTDNEGNPDMIRSVKITKGNTTLYERELNTATTTVTLPETLSGKYVVEVKTNKYKIVKTYWK
ncbi:MAG: CotH kinase family protein [Bacteroidales bacterium]|nr:CotH kinase family protein [Bacteroidales bacterium]